MDALKMELLRAKMDVSAKMGVPLKRDVEEGCFFIDGTLGTDRRISLAPVGNEGAKLLAWFNDHDEEGLSLRCWSAETSVP
ncbi:hypothetical protein FHS19_005069 [Paenibacillus rhizosphaerae]|uniref:Uncharacterized protein n=1 Tax=Paenibacillus rhizosphaerae TaxID=297318 RepID=A0A839TTG7_9BACL|nr:hypothetical protein [Paenibacillus rhizosphaerae]MBB3130364.1 hypothetical protein [Paenibacillus rhizosphaerae]